MKNCPKCKAELQEEARFCLYCMTSFEEKQTIEVKKEDNKRWLYIIAAVLAVALIVISIILFAVQNKDTNDSISDTKSSHFISETNTSGDDNSESTTTNSQNSSVVDNTNSSGSSGAVSSNSKPSNSKPSNSTQSNFVPSNSTPSNPSSADDTTSDDVSSVPDTTEPKYSYVEATIENAYPTGYSAMYAPENAIVITKVNYKEKSGNYVIPNTIDGKKVAAIMPSAFSDSAISSSVKSVTLPATVRTIWGDAFKNCYNLTDLYISSSVIGIYENAFPALANRNGKLTIHCKRDCRNFEFYYYRNISDDYDAEYEEWNG